MPETQWMTLLETADLMKRLPIQVTRMCEDGKLEYYMEDGRYFVSRESIDLFMHSRSGGAASANTDTNGTPRRKYGRAPVDFEPSSTTAAETEAVNGRDQTDAAVAGVTGITAEDAPGTDDENLEAWEDTETPEAADETMDGEAREEVTIPETANVPVEAQKDVATPETANVPADIEAQGAEEKPQAAGHLQGGGQTEPGDDVAQIDETLLRRSAGAETPIHEKDQAASTVHPDDTNARAVEILADLRAAITRHAVEHKAFCDEIAGLADALESTLSQDGDKTTELTREISSLLARYARR